MCVQVFVRIIVFLLHQFAFWFQVAVADPYCRAESDSVFICSGAHQGFRAVITANGKAPEEKPKLPACPPLVFNENAHMCESSS